MDAVPAPHPCKVLLHSPTFMGVLMAITKPFLSAKLRRRVVNMGSDLER